MQKFLRKTVLFCALALPTAALEGAIAATPVTPAKSAQTAATKPAQGGPAGKSTSKSTTPRAGAYQPTAADLKTHLYRVPGWKDYSFFYLKDGWSCLGTDSVHLDDYKLGDLNGDGLIDAAVIISVNTGGTGTLTSMYALINNGKQLFQSYDDFNMPNTELKSWSLRNRCIALSYLAQKEDDPNLAAPTVKTRKLLKLKLPPLSSLKEKQQVNLARFEAVVPKLDEALNSSWTTARDQWKKFDKMTQQEWQDQFSVMHGPRIDFKTRPKFKAPPAGSSPFVVDFTINTSGYVSDVKFTKSSGIQIYDQTVLDSLNGADFESALKSDPAVMQGLSDDFQLHVRAIFSDPIKCELAKTTLPTLGSVFPQ